LEENSKPDKSLDNMNCNWNVTVGLSLLCLLLRKTKSALTVAPPNQVAVIGAQVILPCALNTISRVSWTAYPVTGQKCRVFTGFSMGPCIDRTRYNVTLQPNGQFNSVISNTDLSDAGTFVCTDLNTSLSASAVFGVVDCPGIIKVKDSNGHEFAGGPVKKPTEVHCSVEGGSSSSTTTYMWTDPTNGDVLNISSIFTISVGDYIFTCAASSTVSCGVCRFKLCRKLMKTISRTAYLTVAVTTLSTLLLITVVYCLCRRIKDLSEESVQLRNQMLSLQPDLTDVAPRDYEQLNECSLQLNSTAIYQELTNNNRL
jgi:hypothetical protein